MSGAKLHAPLFTYDGSDCGFSANDLDLSFFSEYLMDHDDSIDKNGYGSFLDPLPDTSFNKSFDGKRSYSNQNTFSEDDDVTDTSDDKYDKKMKYDESTPQEVIDKRKERNRVLARKTRQRKKYFFESLQKQLSQLAVENDMLKSIIKHKMRTDIKNQVLAECNTEIHPIVTQSAQQASAILDRSDFGLMNAIQTAQRSFCITDPSLPDNPIIFASKAFLELTKYKLEDVIGRNCRFLQGPGTDQAKVRELGQGISQGVDTAVVLLNYKADGTPFYNQIFVAALRDIKNNVINYVGVQLEVYKDRGELANTAVPIAAKKGRPRTRHISDNNNNNTNQKKGDNTTKNTTVVTTSTSTSNSMTTTVTTTTTTTTHCNERQKLVDEMNNFLAHKKQL